MLTAGSIKFAPDLPKRTLDAASKVSLGSYDHIALQLPGNPLGLSRDDVVIEQSKDLDRVHDRQYGRIVAVLDRCRGFFGRDLSARAKRRWWRSRWSG